MSSKNSCNLRFIKILSWNCAGIKNKLREFQNFVYAGSYDVVALQETHLHQLDKLFLFNYKIYRRDRDRRGGGVAVAIKISLEHKALSVAALSTLECIGIAVNTRSGPIHIFSIYQPATKPIDEAELRVLFTDRSAIYIGDWNSKHPDWGCRSRNSNGATLHRIADEALVSVEAPFEATHYVGGRAQSSDILDFAITKNLNGISTPCVLQALTSDHLPIQTTIRAEARPAPRPPPLIRTNWCE
jgi:endonuclease/exonuclease/phosphatase family metal-dependent hydrolase